MKVFISLPMKGKTDEQIKDKRDLLFKVTKMHLEGAVDKDIELELIDSFFEGCPHEMKPLGFLGESIKKLADADVAVFADGWEYANGCVIEHECAVRYGIPCLYED